MTRSKGPKARDASNAFSLLGLFAGSVPRRSSEGVRWQQRARQPYRARRQETETGLEAAYSDPGRSCHRVVPRHVAPRRLDVSRMGTSLVRSAIFRRASLSRFAFEPAAVPSTVAVRCMA